MGSSISVQADVSRPRDCTQCTSEPWSDGARDHFRLMNWMPPETPPFGDRIDFLWKRGVRFLSDAAIAFAMSAATAIGVGIAVSDNAFIQILVIPLVALAFWVPFFFIVLRVHMWLAHRRTDHRREPGSAPPARRSWRQKLRSIFEMMTGRGLDRDVLAAYCFLCRHYREGDRIYLFGFSRGAYTVRVVAGLIYLIGLLREHQINFAGFALKAYKSASETDNFLVAQQFRRVVTPQTVPIHFLGVWDTVLSIIVPGRLPFSKLRLEELPTPPRIPQCGRSGTRLRSTNSVECSGSSGGRSRRHSSPIFSPKRSPFPLRISAKSGLRAAIRT